MIKIFRQRTMIDSSGKENSPMVAIKQVGSLAEMLDNLPTILESIPLQERFNLHYSLCNLRDGKHADSRLFDSQEIMPFDFDGIDVSRIEEYVTIFLTYAKLSRDEVTIVCSGNGLHILVWLSTIIDDAYTFESLRPFYKTFAGTLKYYFTKANLPCKEVDTGVFAPSHTLRLPNTLNVKDSGTTHCNLISKGFQRVPFDLRKLVQIDEVNETDAIHPRILSKTNTDPVGVLQCPFLVWCKENQNEVTEQQWYAMLSILGRLEKGRELCHTYSCEYSKYDSDETDLKTEYAVNASGPRTCKNIATMFEGCDACPFAGKVASPIIIKSETWVKSADTGYWLTKMDKNGIITPDKPDFDGMIKRFEQLGAFITDGESRLTYRFNGKHWLVIQDLEILSFAQELCSPSLVHAQRQEFLTRLKCFNIRNTHFFVDNIADAINFNNGYLSLRDMQMHPHSATMGFLYALSYDFDPEAKCPTFDRFLQEVTLEDESMQQLLMEFAGYSISNCSPARFEKAMVLYGDGANGKSVFLDVLKELAGKQNYACLTMKEIEDKTMRYSLYGKLFNASQETPTNSLADSTVFKALITGEETQVKKLYAQPFNMRSNAKLLFACNNLPPSNDSSHGLFRKMLIVPFKRRFQEEEQDRDLRDKLFAEKAGILNRAIKAYKDLTIRGRFVECKTVKHEIDNYIQQNDVTREWFNYAIQPVEVRDLKWQVKRDCESVLDMYDSFKEYCIKYGDKNILSLNSFTRKLHIIHDGEVNRVTVHGRRQTVKAGLVLGQFDKQSETVKFVSDNMNF